MQNDPTESPTATIRQESPLLSTQTTQSYGETQTVSVSLSTSESLDFRSSTKTNSTAVTTSFSTLSEAKTKSALEMSTTTTEPSRIQNKSSFGPKSTSGLNLVTEITLLATTRDKGIKALSTSLPAVVLANASFVNESSAYVTNGLFLQF